MNKNQIIQPKNINFKSQFRMGWRPYYKFWNSETSRRKHFKIKDLTKKNFQKKKVSIASKYWEMRLHGTKMLLNSQGNRGEGPPIEWEVIFASLTPNKGLASSMHKELKNLS